MPLQSYSEMKKDFDEAFIKSKEFKIDYVGKLESLIDDVFNTDIYKDYVDWLCGQYPGKICIDPMPSEAELTKLKSVAANGVDAYLLYVRGTSDDYEYLKSRLKDFYNGMYLDLRYSDAEIISHIVWRFDSISLEEAVRISNESEVCDLQQALEGEIYDRFVPKKD